MENNIRYNEKYYENYMGQNYHEQSKWEPLFRRFAQHIVDDFNPKTVLDAGCAFGYMVEYLRELGVEAWGIDASNYAISQAKEEIRPFLRVASIIEALPNDIPQTYDIILNIEVIEHLHEEDGLKALGNLTHYSDTIFFSSTGEDITNPTHFNVQQTEYWAEKFSNYGFYRNLTYNTEYLSKYSGVYERKPLISSELIRDYEHYARIYKMNYEKEQTISSKLLNDVEIVRSEREKDEMYFRKEIQRLTEEGFKCNQKNIDFIHSLESNKLEISDAQTTIEKLKNDILILEKTEALKSKQISQLNEYILSLQIERERFQNERNQYYQEKEYLRTENEKILSSRGYRLLQKGYRIEGRLLPIGSKRRMLVKKLLKRSAKLLFQRHKSSVSLSCVEENNSSNYIGEFYNLFEKERHEYCKKNPIDTRVKFSIIVPLYNTPVLLLEELVNSVFNQIYENWELCFVNASDNKKEIASYLQPIINNEHRIYYKELEHNGGISENTKEGLKLATGDFIALLDHDDLLAPNALYEYALCLITDPEIDFFYSDKDMMNEVGTQRINPLYKPECSPEIMFSANYLTHFSVIRKKVLDKTIGFSKETDGAQDWDIFLKVMEHTNKFKRVPYKLYHWRIISTSVASGLAAKPYVLDAQLKTLNNYIKRKGWNGMVYFSDRGRSILKVDWNFKDHTDVLILLLSDSGEEKITIKGNHKTCAIKNRKADIEKALEGHTEDVLLFIDCDECSNISSNLINELSSWALHPEIGFVSPMLTSQGVVKSCGLVYDKGEIMDLFADKSMQYYGEIGGTEWYRNLSLFRSTCLAIERSKYLNFCTIDESYGSLHLSHNCISVMKEGYRNVYDCFAFADVNENFTSIHMIQADFNKVMHNFSLTENDPYFNSNVVLDVNRLQKKENITVTSAVEIDKYTNDAVFLSSFYDFTAKDLQNNQKVINNDYHENIETMVWFLPEFDYAFYAGLYTIFRTAEYLRSAHKMKHTFVFLSGLDVKVMLGRIGEAFPELGKCKGYCVSHEIELKTIGSYDASVCTLWTTAFYSLKMNRVKKKFYFIQDYEPLFYPGGSTYAQAEASYRFGFYGITNTKGLKMVYEKEFGGQAVALNPSIDTNIFYPNDKRIFEKSQYTLFFYGRPGHPRNGFELGVSALKLLKKRMGNRIRIITAGSEYDIHAYGLEGVIENLGRLKVEETGELYRTCDVGLVMMFTRHPSYLPYEMMACGCTVVSNYNAYTSWFLKDGENCIVTEASAGSISDSIEQLLSDKQQRENLSIHAANEILKENPTWEESLEKVAKFILIGEKENDNNKYSKNESANI